jgi:integrase
MANRVAGLLSQMFRYGIHRQVVESSPVQLLFRPGGTERPRQRALDDEELAALLANVDEVTKRAKRTGIAIRVILLTAVRRSELTGARWSELDLEAKAPVWDIPSERTKTGLKTGVGFAVPLTPAALEQFNRLKRLAGRSPWVLPAETGEGAVDPRLLTRSIARHLETFGEHKVGAFTLHDLRRTVRTGLAKLGIRPDIAERCLNHAQPGIIATYDTHQYLEEKRDALTQWADHLQALRDGK